MATLSERIPTPSSFERTSNVLLAIAGAFLIAVIVWYTTENQIYTVAAALVIGYLLLGVRIVRPLAVQQACMALVAASGIFLQSEQGIA